MSNMMQEVGNADSNVNDYLRNLANELETNPPTDTNDGHNKLMTDLADVVKDAHEYQYHDYKNKKYPAPKVALRNRLLQLAENVVNGKYDN